MLNYTVHAMEELEKTPDINHFKMGAICDLLANAEKFVLPHNGILLEQEERLATSMDVSIINLPYPITTIEFPGGFDNGQVSAKHIVLCMEYDSDSNNVYAKIAERAYPQIITDGGIIVIPILNLSGKNGYIGWSPSTALFVISKKYTSTSYSIFIAEQCGLMSKLPMNIYPYPLVEEHERLYLSAKSEWCSSAVRVFERDIYAIFHLLVHLSCRNVETVYNLHSRTL